MNKYKSRMRRLCKSRLKMKSLKSIRLVVHRTSKHIYAQIIDINSNIIVSSSTLEKSIVGKIKNTGNKIAASIIGKDIAKKSLNNGIKKVSFDKSGFKYHGRVKELAESARSYGLKF